MDAVAQKSGMWDVGFGLARLFAGGEVAWSCVRRGVLSDFRRNGFGSTHAVVGQARE